MEVKPEILGLMAYLENIYKKGPSRSLDGETSAFDLQLSHYELGFVTGLVENKIVEIQDRKVVNG